MGATQDRKEIRTANKGGRMKISEFALLVCAYEKGKKQVNIAQINEVLKVSNGLTDGGLYKLIRKSETRTLRRKACPRNSTIQP